MNTGMNPLMNPMMQMNQAVSFDSPTFLLFTKDSVLIYSLIAYEPCNDAVNVGSSIIAAKYSNARPNWKCPSTNESYDDEPTKLNDVPPSQWNVHAPIIAVVAANATESTRIAKLKLILNQTISKFIVYN